MLKSSLCDYSDVCILVSGTITITEWPENTTDANKWTEERNKEIIIKNCTPSIECIGKWIIPK